MTTLRELALEHVMRLVDSDELLLAWTATEPGSTRARTALGRTLWDTPAHADPGTPLVVYAAGGEVDPGWRDRVTTAPASLWGELEVLEQLVGHGCAGPCSCDPAQRLFAARERAAG